MFKSLSTNNVGSSQQNQQNNLIQACKLVEQGIQYQEQKQFTLAKVILVNACQVLMDILKQNGNPQSIMNQDSKNKAQQYIHKALQYAEESKKQIEIQQTQISQQDPYIKMIIECSLIRKSDVSFATIAGLDSVKKVLNEAIVLPNLRPDLFTGIRAPHKGNGKTLLAKAVANQSKCCFFNMSASSLVSKHFGEAEKVMRALFRAAYYFQPCVIFLDEIDSILSARSENEHEASRRLKTEFLVQFDGVQSSDQDRVIFIGATNRPQDMDDAVLRRFSLKILIDQPDEISRLSLIKEYLKQVNYKISEEQMNQIVKRLNGYSASDIKAVMKEASMQPLRSQIKNDMILTVSKADIRQVSFEDVMMAANAIPPTLNQKQHQEYIKFDKDRKFKQ